MSVAEKEKVETFKNFVNGKWTGSRNGATFENVSKRSARDFDRRLNDEPDYSPYDYASIMHYGAFADSCAERSPTIETIPPGIPIGQRKALSLGDFEIMALLFHLQTGLMDSSGC